MPIDSNWLWRTVEGTRSSGLRPHDIAAVAAQMLAASVLDNGERTLLTEPRREWTAHDLEEAFAASERAFRERVGSEVVSPFAAGPDYRQWPPGTVELVRQGVEEALRAHEWEQGAPVPLERLLSVVVIASGGRHLGAPSAGLVSLTVEALAVAAGERAYCAYDATGEVALHLASRGVEVTLDVPEAGSASFWAALAAASGLGIHVYHTDPLRDFAEIRGRAPDTFDAAVVAPPFGMKTPGRHVPPGVPSSADAAGIALAAWNAQRGVCLVPTAVLFRASLEDQSFRDKALRDYGLSAVMSVPAGAWRGTGIQTALVILDNSARVDAVLMVDLSEGKSGRKQLEPDDVAQAVDYLRTRRSSGSSQMVGLDEIAANAFNLTPERYVVPPDLAEARGRLAGTPFIPLNDLAEIYRPQATPPHDPPEGANDGMPVFEVVVSDLDEHGRIVHPAKRLTLGRTELQKARKAELQVGDILLVTKGSVGKVGLVTDVPEGQIWLANQSFAIIRLRRHAPLRHSSRLLWRYLASPLGQRTLGRLRIGSAITSLQMPDIRSLEIPIPGHLEQDRIQAELESLFSLQSRIAELREVLARMEAGMWPEAEP
jgi:type I restriction enzyme M protein